MEATRPGNQLHGKVFENLVQAASGCPVQNFNALFDLPAMYDDYGMQVQVKTVNEDRNTIDLADASRFWRNDAPIHLIVGTYTQVGLSKVFYAISEYILGKNDLAVLKGKLPSWEVERMHSEVRSYKRGEHEMARSYAQATKDLLVATYGKTPAILRPKIDNQSQRRIQCSVKLADLDPYLFRVHQDEFRGIKLPLALTFTGDDE